MPKLRLTTNGVAFRCPGCDDMHVIPTQGDRSWLWNGSRDSPTISPSVDIKSGHYASAWSPGDPCWCGTDYGYRCYRCHFTISEGRITFAPDSLHALSGHAVDLPDI